jgi:hypothetical protein
MADLSTPSLSPKPSSVLIPSYPPFLRPNVRMMATQLGQPAVREIQKQFLLPLRRAWAKQFALKLIDHIRTVKNPSDARLALKAKLEPSSFHRMKEEGQLSLEPLLATVRETAMPWHLMPAVPMDRELHVQCYMAAVSDAENRFAARRKIPAPPFPLKEDGFEHLLWLFREPSWFIPSPKLAEHRREIAARVCHRAHLWFLRCKGFAEVVLPGTAGDLHWDDVGADEQVRRLERLQQAYGAGWMIAVEIIRYRWEV